MTCKSRIQAALRFQSTSYVPYAFGFCPPVAERLRQHYGVEEPFVALGMHIFAVGPRSAAGFEPPANGVDEFGVTWHTTPFGARLPLGHPMPEPKMQGFEWPDVHASGRFEHIGPTMAAHKDRFGGRREPHAL